MIPQSILIFPNPSDGKAFLAMPALGQRAMSILGISTNGKVLETWRFSDVSGMPLIPLYMSGTPPGLYFLHVETGGNTLVKKLVIE